MSTKRMDYKKSMEMEEEGKKTDNVVALIKGAKIFKTEVEEQRIEHLITKGLEDNDISEFLNIRASGANYNPEQWVSFKETFTETFEEYLEDETDNLKMPLQEALEKIWGTYVKSARVKFATVSQRSSVHPPSHLGGGGKRKSKRKSRKSHKKRKSKRKKSRKYKSRKSRKTKKRRR